MLATYDIAENEDYTKLIEEIQDLSKISCK
jgi:hypothetical protein